MKGVITSCYLLIYVCFALHCQQSSWDVDLIDINDGLSSNQVECVFQDSDGFMWFGTQRGLNRYDGYQFKTYFKSSVDTTQLYSDWITDICEDEDGILWLATTDGLQKFDKKTELFTRYIFDVPDSIKFFPYRLNRVTADKDGYIWCASSTVGLLQFDKNKLSFSSYISTFPDSSNRPLNNLSIIFDDDEGGIWISHFSNFIERFDKKRKVFEKYHLKECNDNDEPIWTTECIQHRNKILIGGNCGIVSFSKEQSEISSYLSDSEIPGDLDSNFVIVPFIDSEDNIWVRTIRGIFTFNKQKKIINHLPLPSESINLNTFFSSNDICQSRDGVIWLNSSHGIYRFSRKVNHFNVYKHNPQSLYSLSNNVIESITDDKYGNIWVGTSNGLNRLNIGDGTVERFIYNPNDSTTMFNHEIKTLFTANNGDIWIGTTFGLHRYSESDGKEGFDHFFNIKKDSNSLGGMWVVKIFEDGKGRLWVSLSDGIPKLFNREENRFIHLVNRNDDIPEIGLTTSIVAEDKNGNLWARGFAGAYLLSPFFTPVSDHAIKAERVIPFRHQLHKSNVISHDQIIDSYLDADGAMWLGTWGSGLNKIKTYTNDEGEMQFEIKHYTQKDGLPNNVVYSILDDGNGSLWLGTDNGLSRFHKENETFTNYFEEDGLPSNKFFWEAKYKTSSGQLFFGTIDGMVSFFPDSIDNNDYSPLVVITDIKLFDKSMIPEESSYISSSAPFVKQIKLPYHQNSLSFEFSVLNFQSSAENQYRYFLEGYDKEWINNGSINTVKYSNLSHGKYVFNVIGANSDGIWNKQTTSVQIVISPPWWRSKISYGGYLIGVSMLLIGIIRFRERKLLKDRQLLEEKVRKRTELLKEHQEELIQQKEELQQTLDYLKETQSQLVHSEKMASIGQLTAGIAHEINNPVNYISAGIGSLKTNIKELRVILDLYKSITPDNVIEKLEQINIEEQKIDIEETRQEVRTLIKTIEKGAERTTEIVKGLRSFSRLDEDEIKAVDIHEGIDVTLLMLRNKYKHHVEIRKEYGHIPAIECYPGKLNQVFMNIISNAIDAINNQGLITIKTSNSKVPDKVQVLISDTGVGMDREQLKHIFNPFYTTKEVGKGTGLGLSISHGIITQHKGTIEVTSVPGKGTEMLIILPVKQ